MTTHLLMIALAGSTEEGTSVTWLLSLSSLYDKYILNIVQNLEIHTYISVLKQNCICLTEYEIF